MTRGNLSLFRSLLQRSRPSRLRAIVSRCHMRRLPCVLLLCLALAACAQSAHQVERISHTTVDDNVQPPSPVATASPGTIPQPADQAADGTDAFSSFMAAVLNLLGQLIGGMFVALLTPGDHDPSVSVSSTQPASSAPPGSTPTPSRKDVPPQFQKKAQ